MFYYVATISRAVAQDGVANFLSFILVNKNTKQHLLSKQVESWKPV